MRSGIPLLTGVVLVVLARPAAADLLDCSSRLAIDKQVIQLGKKLQLVTCTDASDPVLGRAYFRYVDRRARSTKITELTGIGGCGRDAVQARREGDDILVTFRTCSSRAYHPKPKWVVRSYRFVRKTHALVEKRWSPR